MKERQAGALVQEYWGPAWEHGFDHLGDGELFSLESGGLSNFPILGSLGLPADVCMGRGAPLTPVGRACWSSWTPYKFRPKK
jgi:hypothetical protein